MFCVLWVKGIDSPHALVKGGEGARGRGGGAKLQGVLGSRHCKILPDLGEEVLASGIRSPHSLF